MMFTRGSVEPQPPGIEVVTTPEALARFADQQTAVTETVRRLGLMERAAVLIGTAALTMYDVHASVDYDGRGPTGIDVDAIVSEEKFVSLLGLQGATHLPATSTEAEEVKIQATVGSLSFTGIRASDPEEHALFPGSFNYNAAQVNEVNGVLVLPLMQLLSQKLTRAMFKDYVGILQAQAVAWAMNNPLLNDAGWQERVAVARELAEREVAARPSLLQVRPYWFGRLVKSGFKHPAFESRRHGNISSAKSR